MSSVLLIGYGNPGRLDDGLGPALAQDLESMNIAGVVIDADYQLTVEDAAVLKEHDLVLFADAALTGPEPFYVSEVFASENKEISFSTHSIDPIGVVTLAEELFSAKTPAFVIGIRGYDFNEFGEKLSDRAKENLAATKEFLVDILKRHVDRAELIKALKACSIPLPKPAEAA